MDATAAVAPTSRLLLAGSESEPVRDRAAEALGRIARDDARSALLAALAIAPVRLQRAIAGALSNTKDGAEALLSAVEAGKASATLLREPGVQIRLNNAGIASLPRRLDALTNGLPPADAALRRLIDARLERFASADVPDPSLGRTVFEQHCAACHQVDGLGNRVGPQLDGVGVRGPGRLMEDILHPNLNVDQAFRSTTLALVDGRVLSGLLLSEEGDVLVLADAEGKSQRIPSTEVDDRTTLPVSPMPANFGERIPEDEFDRLIAYLLSRKDAGDSR